MGFLYQLLKDVSEKQPYSVGKNELKKLVNDLESNLSTGREGFSVIAQVAGKVGEYNESVRESNKSVRTPIDNIIKHVKEGSTFEKYVKKIEVEKFTKNESVMKAETVIKEKLEECKKYAETFNNAFDVERQKAMRDAINDLNPELRNKIMNAVKAVKHESERLCNLTTKEESDLGEMKQKIGEVMDKLKNDVKMEIAEKIEELVKRLKDLVQEILYQLKGINNLLIEYVKRMDNWMKQTKEFINKTPQENVKKLKEEIRSPAVAGKDKETLEDSIGKLQKALGTKVSELTKWKSAGDAAVKKAKLQCEEMVRKLQGSDKSTHPERERVTEAAQELQRRADNLRTKAYAAKMQVQTLVTLALGEVKNMDTKLRENLRTVRDGIKKDVMDYIKEGLNEKLRAAIEEETDKIARREGQKSTKPPGQLDKIVEGIKEYAEKFKTQGPDGFDIIVEYWLTNILTSPPVTTALGDYAVRKRDAELKDIFKDGDDFERIAKKLAAVFKEESGKAVVAYNAGISASEARSEIGKIVEAVNLACVAFAASLAKKIKEAKTMKIANAIKAEFNPTSQPHDPSMDEHLLKWAVQPILSELVGAARQFGNAIYAFAGIDDDELEDDNYDLGKNLKNAINGITQLGNHLHGHIQRLDGTHFSNVTGEIASKIQGRIGNDDPENNNDKVTLSDQFKTYKEHVDTSKAAGKPTLDGTEGSLPVVIKNMEKTVNENSSHLGDVESSTGTDGKDDKFYTNTFGNMLKNVESKLNLFTEAVQKLVQGSDNNNDVNAHLSDLEKMLGNDPVALTAAGMTDHKSVKGLETIKGEIEELRRDNIAQITSNLNYLCNTIKRFAEDIDGNMVVLTDQKIDTDLKNIREKLHELQSKTLDKAIKDTERFIKAQADNAGRHIIAELHDFVSQAVDDATQEISTKACRNYVCSIRESIKAFVSKVDNELRDLPNEIDRDTERGFKGFLVRLQRAMTSSKNSKNLVSMTNTKVVGDLCSAFQAVWDPLHTYLLKEIKRVHDDENSKRNPQGTDADKYSEKQKYINFQLAVLLKHIITENRFDHAIPLMLDNLTSALSLLKPDGFSNPNTPLLETIAHGFRGLVGELGKAYISAYDSETFSDDLVKVDKTLTTYGKYYAKVFLTALRTLDVSLYGLKHECKSLTGQKINSSTDLGRLFVRLGFKVAEENKEHWELQNKGVINGEYVSKRISFRVDGANDNQHLKECESKKRDNDNYFNVFDILGCLLTHLNRYFEVCHFTILPRPRTPCNVYEMLVWLTGLPHNPVYEELLEDGLSAPFKDPAKQTKEAGDGFEFTVFDLQTSHIDAYPSNITYKNTATTINHICSKAYDVLATIVGNGNASTVYACDFPSNTLNLKYPAGGEDCLNTLLDILRNLLPQLQYLFHRCNVTDTCYGWRNCTYGRDVPTAKWPCIDHPSDKPKHEATCQTKCKPNCKPTCQPTSPLMSYLNDCLSAHLPHQIVTVGCKSECKTCPSNSPGMPCRMPFGFRGFSGSTKTGMDICESIRLFLGSGLVSSLLCLIPRPPSTLPEHFNFALQLGNMLHKGKNSSANSVSAAFIKSIENASIRLFEDPMELTDALGDAYGNTQADHSHTSGEPKHAPLSSLSMKESCMLPKAQNIFCGPYLQSLCHDSYYSLAEKHCSLYLSWVIYLPWQFWNYLKNLYDSFCSISCQDWGCSGCLKGDKCKTGKHGTDYNCKCWSVVRCRGVQSTFYSYGFTFGDAEKLLDDNELRYCHDFCKQLENILSSQFFEDLLQKCDEFLFKIRAPFIWLTVALWSLSLFYLICVMVGRLDVLHIKSHLRIPSSHKITAQSLLAAAQVGRLAKISYLQP